jgi:hypothetical protein
MLQVNRCFGGTFSLSLGDGKISQATNQHQTGRNWTCSIKELHDFTSQMMEAFITSAIKTNSVALSPQANYTD